MTKYVITAGATEDGRPIYRRADGAWSDRVAEAARFDDEPSSAAALEAARREERVACDPYPIEVQETAQGIEPVRLKERIRAHGPTVV